VPALSARDQEQLRLAQQCVWSTQLGTSGSGGGSCSGNSGEHENANEDVNESTTASMLKAQMANAAAKLKIF
jgi:hypothetical protein